MTRIAQQVSRAIRILRGNRDESARASHLVVNKVQFVNNELLQVGQAEREKCSQSTFFERKIMSTKTAFKRVALVAAAALAIGGVSAVSANAVAGPAAPVFPVSASAVTGTYTTVTLNAGSNDKYYTITSSGVGSVLYPAAPQSPDATGLVAGASEVWYAGGTPGATTFNAGGTDVLTFSVYSATAGSQTLTITGNSTAANTTTITWGAAPVLSVGNSFVVANNATDIAAGTVGTTAGTLKVTSASADSSLAFQGSPSNTLAGGATVGVYNNATTPASIGTDTISASVSGPGLLTISKVTYGNAPLVTGAVTVVNTSAQGRSVSTTTAAAYAIVNLYSDGTSGTSTVTVSDATAGVVLGTFTVTFYSTTIAKLVATTLTNVPVAAVTNFATTATEGINGSSVATGGAPVSVVATDANGNKIPSAAGITVTSGTTSVATVGAVTYDATNGYSYVNIIPVSEGSTVLTFTDTATGLVTATATVLVTSAVASTVVASTDAATYDPGTKVVYKLTAADAKGNPIADGTYSGFFSTAPTSNVGLQGALPGLTSVTFAGGVSNSTVYSPVNSANVVIAGGTVVAGFLASATATATNEADFSTTGSSDTAANAATDAANEATDAANAATDAANAAADSADAATQAAQDAGDKADAALAAVTALSQQVTTLLAKVAALASTIAKIAKKVKA